MFQISLTIAQVRPDREKCDHHRRDYEAGCDSLSVFLVSCRWDDYDKYKNADAKKVLHFPGFSNDAAKLLAEDRNIAGIGIDTLSVDYGMSTDFMVHHISHGKGKFHLENVANLGSLPPTGAFVVVAPIKVENGTGGPARIFALIKK